LSARCNRDRIAVKGEGVCADLSTADHPIIALIGRDLMADWILIYNGHVGLVSISF
jgi:hypothetical protein